LVGRARERVELDRAGARMRGVLRLRAGRTTLPPRDGLHPLARRQETRGMHDGPARTVAMTATATVEVEGHIIDSLILAKILDTIVDAGADYQIVHIDVGRRQADPSHARIEVTAPDDESLQALLTALHP